MKGSFTVLILYCLLYTDGQITDTNEIMKDETVCFETVSHYYSNPKITGESALVFGYKNDDFKSEVLTLSCEEEDEDEGGKNLYIEVKSVTLSLPARGEEAKYCVESQHTLYENCTESKQCDCCEKPDDTCIVTVDIRQYSSCNREKSCKLTVTSQFLSDCPGRQYDCDGGNRKCHSRWADATYKCRPIDVIRTTPKKETSGGQSSQPWWIIFILAAIILIIVVGVILYRKYMKTADQKPSEEKKNEEIRLNTGGEYENLKDQERQNRSSSRETYAKLSGPEYENVLHHQRDIPSSSVVGNAKCPGTEYENLQDHTRNNPDNPTVAATTPVSGTEYEGLQHQGSNDPNPPNAGEMYETFEQQQCNSSAPQENTYTALY